MVAIYGHGRAGTQTFDVRCHLNTRTTCGAAAEEMRVNKKREAKTQAVTVLAGEASLNNRISASPGLCKAPLNWRQNF